MSISSVADRALWISGNPGRAAVCRPALTRRHDPDLVLHRGKFWYYDVDETIVILEGSIVLERGMPPKRYGVSDVVLFRDGRTPDGTLGL